MGVITLLSDLGYNDAGVANTKGILLQELPDAQIIDITHNIQPFYLQQAAYLLVSSVHHFPKGTCHLVLFDIFYNSSPQLVLADVDGQYILAPDNGVLPLAFKNQMNAWHCYDINEHGNLATWVKAAASIIAKLNNAKPEDIGLPVHTFQNAPHYTKPGIFGNYIECHVMYIDRFENVVLNLTRDEFETAAQGRAFSINFMRDDTITSISSHYNAVRQGEKLCRFNSAGYLEIAINKGKAASLFGLRVVHDEQLLYNTIKINFE